MHRTQSGTSGQTDGPTVRLLYASQHSFGDDEVTEELFDMSNVRIFKEIEKIKMGDVYTLLCLVS